MNADCKKTRTAAAREAGKSYKSRASSLLFIRSTSNPSPFTVLDVHSRQHLSDVHSTICTHKYPPCKFPLVHLRHHSSIPIVSPTILYSSYILHCIGVMYVCGEVLFSCACIFLSISASSCALRPMCVRNV